MCREHEKELGIISKSAATYPCMSEPKDASLNMPSRTEIICCSVRGLRLSFLQYGFPVIMFFKPVPPHISPSKSQDRQDGFPLSCVQAAPLGDDARLALIWKLSALMFSLTLLAAGVPLKRLDMSKARGSFCLSLFAIFCY